MSAKTKTKAKKSPSKISGKSSPCRVQKFQQSNGQLAGFSIRSTASDSPLQWADWQQYLRTHKRPKSLEQLYGTESQSSLLWSLTPPVANSELMRWIEACSVQRFKGASMRPNVVQVLNVALNLLASAARRSGKGSNGKANKGKASDGRRTKAQLNGQAFCADQALLLVAVASVMPALAEFADESSWIDVVSRLVDVAGNASIDSASDPWTVQLLRVELPLTLAYQLPELDGSDRLAGEAAKIMQAQWDKWLDGDGWIHADLLDFSRPLLATWTRAWHLCKSLEQLPLRRDSQLQWEWFVRQSMRLMRSDGSQMLAPADDHPWCHALFRSAIKTSADPEDAKISKRVFPNGPKSNWVYRTADENEFSEWAGLGVLHSDWGTKRPKIAVAIRDADLQFELCCGKPLLQGVRLPEISCNGRPLPASGPWDVLCSVSDEAVEYLEIELDLENGLRVQRQFLVARDDDFALISDVVISPQPERIDYRLEIELAPDTSVIPESETAEVYLAERKIRSLVLPLTLAEWKCKQSEDRLHSEHRQLVLSQSTLGKNMVAGLFIDLNPQRSLKPRTWRRLTVAENLETVSRDTAVAFRVRIGKQQWLIYRSVEAVGNRSFFGQNKCCEFFVGRVTADGDATELLSIE